MRDEQSLVKNTVVYILILDICIDEYLGNDINEDQKQNAVNSFKNIEEQRSNENKKYHMYQY